MSTPKLLKEFLNSEKAGGIVLIFCTALSLLIANSIFGESYHDFWKINFAGHTLEHWINDGLMVIFFLLIGLELEREIYSGELSNFKNALLPIFAAIGGMLVPAGIYLLFNFGTPTQPGAGIPMATDIAFALGILSLLGSRVPTSLKIFLTALAVIDDLGAILVIAIFYTQDLMLTNLFLALGVFGVLLLFNKLGVRKLFPYIIGGIIMWYFMLNSGVHATITGVLLAFAIPYGDGKKKTCSYRLQHFLHKPVAFIVLPIFALANTAIVMNANFADVIAEPYSIGILLGLLFGKPIGIFFLSLLAVKLGLCNLPQDLKWSNIFSVGILAGIGFTMSIFITLLAFTDQTIIDNTKLIILFTSLITAILGFVILRFNLGKQDPSAIDEE